MMLNELHELIVENTDSISDFEVVLATTIIDGKPIESGVERRNIEKLEIDDIDSELYLYPSGFVKNAESNNKHYLIKDFLEYHIDAAENYELIAVDRIKHLPGGRTALVTVIIIGALWYEENKELWLLQSPKEQWPDEWFNT